MRSRQNVYRLKKEGAIVVQQISRHMKIKTNFDHFSVNNLSVQSFKYFSAI